MKHNSNCSTFDPGGKCNCEDERTKALKEVAQRWDKFADYAIKSEVSMPLWAVILFDAARKAGKDALVG